jgi:glycosyltransferase involved in cell wall biosynthesis
MPQLFESDFIENVSVVLVSEQRFLRDEHGAIWSQTQCGYATWKRYLEWFGQVIVAARVTDVEAVPVGYRRADGEGVTFEAMPSYTGPVAFVANLPRIVHRMRRSTKGAHLVILRGPSVLSLPMWVVLRFGRLPFAVQVLGDNEAVFRDGLVGGRAARMYGAILARFQRQVCWDATAVSYVTETTLQRKYPNSRSREFQVTDVNLGADAFAVGPRTYSNEDTPLRLVLVGSLEQPYKGIDIALRAIQRAHDHRLIELVVVGDGRLKAEYERLAIDLGIDSQVKFVGSVPSGEAVRAHLKAADLFVIPSRTEGLPRALIEAMAMAMPAVGARVGGIPELLDDAHTFPREGVAELAGILVALTPEQMTLMSENNLRRARAFSLEKMSQRHAEFIHETRQWVFVAQTARRQGHAMDRNRPRRVA